MNALLVKNRPEGLTKEKFEEQWRAAAGLLEPLVKTLQEMQRGLTSISSSDFDCPNHYAKLVHEGSRKQTLQDVLDMLPK